jgi:(2Fe-2S) ferredoxin
MKEAPGKRFNTPMDQEARREAIVASRDPNRLCVTVCGGTGCRVYGSEKVIDALRAEIGSHGIEAEVRMTGCHGFCEQGPVMVIQPRGIFYKSVKPEDVPDIVHKTVAQGEIPRDAGLGQLAVLFNLTPEKAAELMGSAGTKTPTTPNPIGGSGGQNNNPPKGGTPSEPPKGGTTNGGVGQ